MRICLLLPVVAHAFDLTFYSDETCGTPALEVKGKEEVTVTTVTGTSTTSSVDRKVEFSASTITGGTPNECVEYGEEFTVKSDKAGVTEKKFKFAKVFYCSEYGGFNVRLMSKDFKECKYPKQSALTADSALQQFSGFASMCHPVFPGGAGRDSLTNVEVEADENDDGMVYFWSSHSMYSDSDKPIAYYKANCNPAPGDVWAIVLSSVAIVFALVSIGLAVVAKTK